MRRGQGVRVHGFALRVGGAAVVPRAVVPVHGQRVDAVVPVHGAAAALRLLLPRGPEAVPRPGDAIGQARDATCETKKTNKSS